MPPFLLVQLSDPHLGAEWGGPDPDAQLAAAVDAVLALPQQPDAVLVTGDLTDHGTEAEYACVRELLAPLGAAVHVLPGNQDERVALRRAFGLPGTDAEPVQYAVDLGPLRVVMLDTTVPVRRASRRGTTSAWLRAIARRSRTSCDATRRYGASSPATLHRTMTTELAGRPLLTVPSTYVQFRLDFAATEIELARADQTGFGLHALVGGALVSHVQPVN
jgi:3',5'-cyclic AMP phosphodiesterase CpdA